MTNLPRPQAQQLGRPTHDSVIVASGWAPLLARGSRVLFAALAAGLLVGIAGCTDSPEPGSVADRAGQTGAPGGADFIAGDGSIERVAVAARKDPVELSGQTLDGKPWSVSQDRGKVVVLNVWGSWCFPCEAEMPMLQSTWARLSKSGSGVQFMGVNQRDTVETATAAVRQYGLTFPSLAYDGGRSMLALRGAATATPTTLVLDRKGRIAGRISGPIPGESTLKGLIDDVVAEPAGA